MTVSAEGYGTPELRAHTRKEWEEIRPVLTEIYLRPGFRLDDAMEVMANQYGFFATKMMYKKRLYGWDIKKNLKSIDKDKILNNALLEQQDDHVRRKIQRYMKERRRQDSEPISLHTNALSRTECCSQVPWCNDRSHNTEGPPGDEALISDLACPNDLRDAQQLVRSLRSCLISMESGHEACPFSASRASADGTTFWREHSVQEVFFSFYIGEEALALGLVSDATSYFRVAGRHLVRCLERPSHQLMIDLLGIIRMLSLGTYEAHKTAIYRFLDSIVREKLGQQHPFSTVIALFVQHAEHPEWQRATWESLAQSGALHNKSCCDCIRLQAQSNYGLAMESHRRLDLAIEINEDLLKKELAAFGPTHGATRRTMFRLGRLYYRNQDSGKAISGLQQALDLVQQQPTLSPYDTILLVIYCELASFHEMLDKDVTARKWDWRTLRKSIALLGGVEEDSTWYSYELVDFLRGQR